MRAILKLLFAYAAVAAVAFVHSRVVERVTSDTEFLIVGSIICFALSVLYALVGVLVSYGWSRTLWMTVVVILNLPVMGFTLYVTFVSGAWSLVRLFASFSVESLIFGLLYLVAGTLTMPGLATIVELGKLVDERRTRDLAPR